jgi:type IV secretion system protein VirB2
MYANQIPKIPAEMKILTIAFISFLVFFFPLDVMAQTGGFKAACDNVSGFVETLLTLLRVVSVGVVTIAIIFSGYQIAFAHKRFTDIAPVLIGGLLIGGAGEIAIWFVGTTNSAAAC